MCVCGLYAYVLTYLYLSMLVCCADCYTVFMYLSSFCLQCVCPLLIVLLQLFLSYRVLPVSLRLFLLLKIIMHTFNDLFVVRFISYCNNNGS